MAFQKFKQDMLSNLVAHWALSPYDSYQARVINVSLTKDDVVPQGTVVFRTKAPSNQAAAFTVMTEANAVASLAGTNEFAVVFGDKYSAKTEVVADATANTPMIAFVSGPIQLKDHLLMEALEIEDRADAPYPALKGLLEAQGIIIEKTLDHVPFGA